MERLCGLYTRVSTERQSEIKDGSLDTQMDRLKDYMKFRVSSLGGKNEKWKIIGRFREQGRSGKNMERPELQRLISEIKSGKINAVICTKIDRISRSLIDFYKLMELFEKYHVEFISLEENFDTSMPMGKAMLKITLVFAELEREQTSKRTKDKMQWRAEQGLWNGGQVLGYEIVDKKLVVNKEEAKLVNLIFGKYLELGSVLKVVEYLNSHGYSTKEYISNRRNIKRGGKKFFNANVLQKLTSRTNLGQIEHNGKIYPGQHEAIVDEKLWNEANRMLALHAPKRKNPKRKTKHMFIFLGLLRCGWCDSYMTSKYSTGKKRLHPYYQCTKNSHGGKTACNMKYVPAENFEKAVLKKLKEISQDKKLIEKIVKKANTSNNSIIGDLQREKKNHDNKLRPINNSIENILSAICKGVETKSVKNKLRDLELQKEEIEKDIRNIDFEINQLEQQVLNARAMHESLTRFRQIYATATPTELKELIPRFVEKVIWSPTEIKIALFDHEVERGLPTDDNENSGGGAPEFIDWLPRLDSNQRPND